MQKKCGRADRFACQGLPPPYRGGRPLFSIIESLGGQYLADVIDADDTDTPLDAQREILAGSGLGGGELDHLLHRVARAAEGEGLPVSGVICIRQRRTIQCISTNSEARFMVVTRFVGVQECQLDFQRVAGSGADALSA